MRRLLSKRMPKSSRPSPWICRERLLPTTGLPVAPLRIRYVMADEKAKIPAVAANCKRQLENCAERSRPYGVWIDGYQADPHSARKVSIDVVVRKRVPNAPVTADQAQNLVIEVLSVETVRGSRGTVGHCALSIWSETTFAF